MKKTYNLLGRTFPANFQHLLIITWSSLTLLLSELDLIFLRAEAVTVLQLGDLC